MEAVRPGLDADAGHTALGVAELGVEGRGLDPELLNEIGGRDVGRDDLVGVRGGGARRAVDQQVAAVAARAVVGVPDDVRRLVRPVQPLVTRVGQAGRESHDLVRVAVDQRELREALRVHREAQVGVRLVERGPLGGDDDFLLHGSDFEHDGQVARLVDLEPHVIPDVLLETRDLDRDLVGAGKQIVDLEQAFAVGRGRHRRASCHVRDAHGSPGNRCLAGVRDSAGYPGACFLSEQGNRHEKGHQHENYGPGPATGWGEFRFHVRLLFDRMPLRVDTCHRGLGAKAG